MSRILVIDDDAQVRRVIVRVLIGAGHSAIEAADGQQGIVLFRDAAPDLVITDLVMPGKEGIETIRAIRAIVPDTKVIAMSGSAAGSDGTLYLSVAEKLGADAVIAKPFRPHELLALIGRVLAGVGDA
jgi:CheY-like chemotaxis protein